VDVSQLDGVSVILGALAAGAEDSVKELAKGTVTGAAHAVGQGRDRLVGMLRRGLRKDPLGDAKLTVYSVEPTPGNAEALRSHVIDGGLDRDPDILAAAHELLNAAGPSAIGPGSVAASIIHQEITGGGHTHIGGVQNYGIPPLGGDPR
jgi:hypothetical protein